MPKLAKAKPVAITQPAAEVASVAAAFHIWHGYVGKGVLALKVAKYFAGLTVNQLCELHEQLHGETRGGGEEAAVTLTAFLESHLGVTARTARRYRSWWQSISGPAEHAQLAAKLNTWWQEHQPKALTEGEDQNISLAQIEGSTEDMQVLLNAPDEWGLHELFEEPLKDAGGDSEVGEMDKPDPALQFWQLHFLKRIGKKDYLSLPKPIREQLATALDEVVTEIKGTLKAKAKRPRRKPAKA